VQNLAQILAPKKTPPELGCESLIFCKIRPSLTTLKSGLIVANEDVVFISWDEACHTDCFS